MKKMKKVLAVFTLLSVLLLAFSVAFAAELKVIVEGENFTKEEGGAVKKVDGRPASSNNSAIAGWDNAGHVIEWEVDIPETADYKIVLRYCNGRDWETYRELLIDGQSPNEACKKIVLPATGGFGKDANNYKNLTVVDANNQPVLVNLSKGKHVLRMINRGGAGANGSANFDCIGFLGKDVDPNVLGVPGVK